MGQGIGCYSKRTDNILPYGSHPNGYILPSLLVFLLQSPMGHIDCPREARAQCSPQFLG